MPHAECPAESGCRAVPSTVTGTDLRDRLYNERRIELKFEGHRFFDERRWLIAGGTENRPLRGMQIIKNLQGGDHLYAGYPAAKDTVYQRDEPFADRSGGDPPGPECNTVPGLAVDRGRNQVIHARCRFVRQQRASLYFREADWWVDC